MGSRRVRQVGAIRWVRLQTGERVSQCGRFVVRRWGDGTALWRVWYRDPLLVGGAPAWPSALYDGRKLAVVLQAVAVFAGAVARLKPAAALAKLVERGDAVACARVARERRQLGMQAIADAEDRGELASRRGAAA